MAHTPTEPADSSGSWLFYLVGRLDRAFSNAIADVLAPESLSLPEFSTLLVLGEGAALSNASLARRTFVSPQASHKVTTELLHKDLVKVDPDPDDARRLLVTLTAGGTATLARCTSAVAQIEARATSELTPAERASIFGLLGTTAGTLAGGWFGDKVAEAASVSRRSRRSST